MRDKNQDIRLKTKKAQPLRSGFFSAEEEGFEPPVPVRVR